jgi:hypothetical protein
MSVLDRVADYPEPGPQLAALVDEVREIVAVLLAERGAYGLNEVGVTALGHDLSARLSPVPDDWPLAFVEDPILLDVGTIDNVGEAMRDARGLIAQAVAERMLRQAPPTH